jgi:hypothetical protein
LQRNHQREGNDQHDDIGAVDTRATNNVDISFAKQFREELRLGAENNLSAILEQERNANRSDQRSQSRILANRTIRESFDNHAYRRTDRHRQ